MQNLPKVFISHASEDKERFVMGFAERLRANGIDAWVDRWEMLPGDSLVEKIFEEGIKQAQAMIIVLSNTSVKKRWVREELNAGVVKRISGSYKIIPVLIDDCEVPEALQSIVWERISNFDQYDVEFQRIIASIFNVSDKPPVGPAPLYVQMDIPRISNLTKSDTILLKLACERSIEKGIDWISITEIQADLESFGIGEDEAYDTIEVLNDAYLIAGTPEISGRMDFFQITTQGFETYTLAFMPDFDQIVNYTLLAILNSNLLSNDDIATRLGKPKVLVDYALDLLSSRGQIKVTKTMGGGAHVHDISARARRFANDSNV
jgi:hypothetical protein